MSFDPTVKILCASAGAPIYLHVDLCGSPSLPALLHTKMPLLAAMPAAMLARDTLPFKSLA